MGSEVKDITDNLPFEIPDSWVFVRLSTVCWLGDVAKSTGEKLPYLDAKTLRGKPDKSYLTDGKVVDVGEKVIDDRIQLANDGVVVVGLTISRETKEIIAQTDCQTRGFVYLKDSEYVIKHIIEICEKVVGQLKENPEMEIAEIRSMMKDQSMRYIVKETGKKPVFIGVVVEI